MMVLTKAPFDRCLHLYPVDEWHDVEQRLIELARQYPEYRNTVRDIARNTISVQYDNQGRVLIPERLLNYATISRDAAIIGMLNYIEIWAPDELELQQAKNPPLDEQGFKDLPVDLKF